MPTPCTPYVAPGGYTPELVISRLYRAGATLMALQVRGVKPAGFGSCMPTPLGTIADDLRPAPPSSQRISDMDQVLTWVQLIPESRMDLRKVLNAHCLCSPLTGKPIFSFRKIGAQLGVSHVTVRSYWLEAVGIICAALNRPAFCHQAVFAGTKNLVPAPRKSGVANSAREKILVVA